MGAAWRRILVLPTINVDRGRQHQTGNQTMKATFTALAVAASMLGGAASAQNASMTMEVALSMLELSAERALSHYGYDDTDVKGLTLSQLAGIKAVTSNGDYDEGERKAQIGVVLAN